MEVATDFADHEIQLLPVHHSNAHVVSAEEREPAGGWSAALGPIHARAEEPLAIVYLYLATRSDGTVGQTHPGVSGEGRWYERNLIGVHTHQEEFHYRRPVPR